MHQRGHEGPEPALLEQPIDEKDPEPSLLEQPIGENMQVGSGDLLSIDEPIPLCFMDFPRFL